ncbi:hypothetical protein EIP91_006482 [Steccherinum ochraceum]|uniref:Ribosomal protein S21 n=1 Tax=Steccherinum ochraceum TaxID=92696 RepID=A0A4R0RTH3_9APHY|nr:hypothetical protein EIP91_006482 [Steccherinum ochraceum]
MLPRLARQLELGLRASMRHSSTATSAKAGLPVKAFWPTQELQPPKLQQLSRSLPRPTPDNPQLGNFFTTTSKQVAAGSAPMTMEEAWASRENHISHIPKPQTAYSGRSVSVGGSFNHAYMSLAKTLSANSFVYELRLAERHEKKGAKRRRLASERWRRRFANEVRKKVQLVNEIRRRGA